MGADLGSATTTRGKIAFPLGCPYLGTDVQREFWVHSDVEM
jgi:hypothetical protein